MRISVGKKIDVTFPMVQCNALSAVQSHIVPHSVMPNLNVSMARVRGGSEELVANIK